MNAKNVVGIIVGLVLIIAPIGAGLSGEAAFKGNVAAISMTLVFMLGIILIASSTRTKTVVLPRPTSPPIQASTSICPYCGRSISANFVACPYCGARVDNIVVPQVAAAPVTLAPATQQIVVSEPSMAWYLAPLLFSVVGGLVGYICLKDRHKDMAKNILILGFVSFIVGMFISFLRFF